MHSKIAKKCCNKNDIIVIVSYNEIFGETLQDNITMHIL